MTIKNVRKEKDPSRWIGSYVKQNICGNAM